MNSLKKRICAFSVVLAIVLTFSILMLAVFCFADNIFNVIESPDGKYEIVSWLIDQGGFGYKGAYYIKEKGLLKRWHRIGMGPFSGEWLSETDFSIYHSYPVDEKGSYYREYNVNEILGK